MIRIGLFALRRWWMLALPLAVLMACLAATPVYLTFKPVYRSAAWLRIQETAPSILFDKGGNSGKFVNTQIQIIRSPLILGSVASQPEIASLPEFTKTDDRISQLSGMIGVSPIGGSELYQISCTATHPDSAATIANAVAEAYLEKHRELDDKHLKVILDLLGDERNRWESSIKSQRDQVRLLAKRATGRDPFSAKSEYESMGSHPLRELQKQLVNAQVERTMLEVEIQAYQQLADKNEIEVPQAAVLAAVAQDPEVTAIRQQINRKQTQMQGVKTASARGEKDPFYITLDKEVKQAEERLESLTDDLKVRFREQMESSQLVTRKNRLEEMQARLSGYEILQDELQKRFDKELVGLQQYTGETLDLEFARAELARSEGVFQMIAERSLRLNTEQRAPARISLWDQATPPRKPIEELPYKKLLMVAMAAFCVPFGLAVGWEFMHQRVADGRQLREHSQLALVGEIAALPSGLGDVRHARSKRKLNSLRLFEESVDSLRTGLVLSEPLRNLHVLAVTSAVSAEGKTSISSQFAISLARATKAKVLIIDGDLRAADIHRVFGVDLTPGVCEVLDKGASIADAVVPTEHEGVYLLPAGKRRKSPHQLVGNGAFEALIGELRDTFDYIVIDTAPVLSASESLVMAKTADATLICVRRGHSRVDQVGAVHERLIHAEVKSVGATLIGVPVRDYYYRYGTYGYEAV
jgi:polysaccharide biosynthesis transport protein